MKRFYPTTAFHRYIWVGRGKESDDEAIAAQQQQQQQQQQQLSEQTAKWLVLLDDLETSLPEGYLASVVFIDQWPEE